MMNMHIVKLKLLHTESRAINSKWMLFQLHKWIIKMPAKTVSLTNVA